MDNSNKQHGCSKWRAVRRRAGRHGKITIVTIFAILGMLVLAGFVGNAGHVVTEKVATQNAADAVAFSSAQWMARGMNAVTATNHLLGEVTALVVIVEGLGGPEADLEMDSYPLQSSVPDKVNRQLAGMAYIKGLPMYGTNITGPIDKDFLELVVKDLISKEGEDAHHKAFATIYDSKVVLKRKVTARLIAKFIANIGLYVPPPWGYLSALAAYAAHVIADEQIAAMGVEWVILHGMEKLVTSTPVRKFKVTLLENKLVPALAAHGDYLAGLPSKVAQKRPTSESGVVNAAINDSLGHLEKVYQVKAAIYPTAKMLPPLATLRLPIEGELKPSMKPTFPKEKEWGDDDLIVKDEDNQLDKVKKDIEEQMEKIQKRIEELQEEVENLKKLKKRVGELKKEKDVTGPETTSFNQEEKAIDDDIKEREDLIAERKKDLAKLVEQKKEIDNTVAALDKAPPGSGNISADSEHLAMSTMNQKEERYTQWVRATYPYVNAFRAPILKIFSEYLDRSGAAVHYKKWTDRYTLTKSWQFRSGYRFIKDGKDRGRWVEDKNFEPLRMYVMDGSYDKEKLNSEIARTGRRDRKGLEEWTLSTDEGKKLAEEKFTIIGMTQREVEPLFSPVLYKVASKRGITTFAQAIFYNGNDQQPLARGVKSDTQAKLGWDTLNWDPSATVPEWGAPPAVADEAMWPWKIFTSNKELAKSAKVKLNWQAKLMPVTKSRLLPAAGAATIKSTDMGLNIIEGMPFFDRLVTH